MATYQFSTLTSGQSITFNPAADLLSFDQAAISAANLGVAQEGSNSRVTVLTGTDAGKNVLLLNTSPLQLATSNVSFVNGSALLFGDNSSAQNDNANNTLNSTAGNDLVQGFGGNDTFNMVPSSGTYGNDVIDGGAGTDTLDFSGSTAKSGIVVDLGAGTLTGGGTGGAGSATVANMESVVGTQFADRITGNAAGNYVFAWIGDDTVAGGAGVDTLGGGAGNDHFVFHETGAANADFLTDFTSGADKIHLDAGAMTALGASGAFAVGDARFFAGTAAHDADDRVIYNSGTRQLFYDADGIGSGAQQLIATLQSGATLASTDIVVDNGRTSDGGQVINGTEGNDSLVGGPGSDSINGLGGNDILDGSSGGVDTLDGGAGNDTLEGSHDLLLGGDGNDMLASTGDSVMRGGLGDDWYFMTGSDSIDSDPGGHDTIEVTSGAVTLPSDWEDLLLHGSAGFLSSGTGNASNNFIQGMTSGVSYSLSGLDGDDTLVGSDLADTLLGGNGNDHLLGNGGNNRIDGGPGQDSVGGGTGADSFLFTATPGSANFDEINGFTPGTDKLELDATVMPALGASGNFSAGDARFFAGAGATGGHDADDRIVYNSTNGQVFYDPDGNGPAAGQLIAVLLGAPAIAATDIAVDNGTSGGQVINGTSGNDSLTGGPGNDTLNGFDGNDTLNGGAGTDVLNGGAGNDTYVDAAADTIVDSGGNDTIIYVNPGNVVLQDGIENAILQGSTTHEIVVTGNAGDNRIEVQLASYGGRVIFDDDSGTGDDGNDTMIGGSGNEVFQFSGSGGNDVVDGGGGTDFLLMHIAGTADYRTGMVTGGTASMAFSNIEQIYGSLDNDRMVADDAGRFLAGGFGDDTLVGGAGNDTLSGDVVFDAPADPSGSDSIFGGAGNDLIDGGRGNDTLDGGAGNDTLSGRAGNVAYRFTDAPGTANADQISAFASGMERIELDATVMPALGSSGSILAGDGRFYAAAGASGGHDADDRVVYDTSSGRLYYDADGSGAGAAQLIATLLAGGGSSSPAALQSSDIVVINGTGSGDTLNGTQGNDVLMGHSDAPDTINGFGGDDFLLGFGGDDSISGGDGNDQLGDNDNPHRIYTSSSTLDGGLGNDYYYVNSPNDVVIDAGGDDTLQTTVDYTLPSGIEHMNLEGDAELTVHGNDLANDFIHPGRGGNDVSFDTDTIYGGGGDDTIGPGRSVVAFGEAGNDVLYSEGGGALTGGAGTDTFVLSWFFPLVTPSREPGPDVIADFVSGTDRIQIDATNTPALGASGTFAPGDGRFYAAPGATSGHDADDRVIYDTTSGTLYYDGDGSGSGGASILSKFQGAPTIAATDITVIASGQHMVGTAGDDSLTGGPGNDTIEGLGGNDTLTGGSGADSLVGGDGNDVLISQIASDSGDHFVDTLDGGLGNDTYSISNDGDIVLPDPGGIDTIHILNGGSYTLPGGVENLDMDDSVGTGGTGIGNELDNIIRSASEGGNLFGLGGNDTLVIRANFNGASADGGDGNDTLIGGGAHNSLSGGAGNDSLVGGSDDDTLDGGAGIDTMSGGAGNDTYFVDNAGDVLTDSSGIDTVVSSVSWTLAPGVFENLTLTGTAFDAEGNNLDNRITGNDANNEINARAGNDTLLGMVGNDTFDFSTGGTSTYGNDIIDGGAGTDTVDFGGSGAQSAAVINLAAGALSGGGTAGAGSATLTSIENAIGTQFNDRITGDSHDNFFYGWLGNDTLDGGAGNDSLNGVDGSDSIKGGAGSDTLIGGAGADFFVFDQAPGTANADRVTDFASGTDRLQFDNAAMAALGADGNFAAGDARFFAAAGAAGGHDADDRLVYNTTTGQLFYDDDGSGAHAAQLVVTLQAGAALSATDVSVI